jgi:homopolymeric O-antigen transport system permease protein
MEADILAADLREGAPAPAGRGRPIPSLRIQASSGWRAVDLAEFWRYRELLWFLAGRDVKLRYHQTVLGVAWAVIQPLTTMLIFSLFFGKLAKMPSESVPYPLLALVGLLPWQLFASAVGQSSNSLVAEQRLISKVYFPRLIVPVASVLPGLIDLAVTLLLTLGMIILFDVLGWSHVRFTLALLTLPCFVLFALAAALAVGLWLAALNVQYRDVRYVVPFAIQLWMFATPVVYPSSLVPARYRVLYGLNPMVGVVDGFRWAMLGTTSPGWGAFCVSIGVVSVMLVGGLYYFRRLERSFADMV